MIVSKLKIKNFRNYSEYETSFIDGLNIITGPNGIGKSNIIESISVVSNIKSFRNAKDIHMMRWGNRHYHCSVDVEMNENMKFDIGCMIQNNKLKKKLKSIQSPFIP